MGNFKNEFRTGVTLHEIDSGIDTGPIVDQREIPIYIDDTWLDIRDREFKAIDDILKKKSKKILSGKWESRPQINGVLLQGIEENLRIVSLLGQKKLSIFTTKLEP